MKYFHNCLKLLISFTIFTFGNNAIAEENANEVFYFASDNPLYHSIYSQFPVYLDASGKDYYTCDNYIRFGEEYFNKGIDYTNNNDLRLFRAYAEAIGGYEEAAKKCPDLQNRETAKENIKRAQSNLCKPATIYVANYMTVMQRMAVTVSRIIEKPVKYLNYKSLTELKEKLTDTQESIRKDMREVDLERFVGKQNCTVKSGDKTISLVEFARTIHHDAWEEMLQIIDMAREADKQRMQELALNLSKNNKAIKLVTDKLQKQVGKKPKFKTLKLIEPHFVTDNSYLYLCSKLQNTDLEYVYTKLTFIKGDIHSESDLYDALESGWLFMKPIFDHTDKVSNYTANKISGRSTAGKTFTNVCGYNYVSAY